MIKLGVIGYGARASDLINGPFRKVAPDLKIAGIIDRDESRARGRLAECDRGGVVFYSSLPEMMREAKPDALVIGTRCNSHADFAVEASCYDLPLFLEKPVAISMDQAGRLEKAFSKSKCRVVVSFPLRVSPLCVLTRRFVEEKALGDPVNILAVNYVPYGTGYWEEPYRDYKITGGLFLQKATHDFDYMSYLMDSPIARVSACAVYGKVFGGKKPAGMVCSKCPERKTCLESPENRERNFSGHTRDHPCLFSVDCGSVETGTNEDASSALVEFANGSQGVYTQVFYVRRDAAARGATLSGYLGTLAFDWYTGVLKRVRHHSPFTDTVKAGIDTTHFGGDIELARDFIGLIRGDIKKARTPIETGIQSVYACLAARESIRSGKFEKVRLVSG